MTEPPAERDETRIVAEARAWYLDYFQRRVGARGRDLAEDLAQEAAIGLLRALRASAIENLGAMRETIGKRTWFGYLRREYRWRNVWDDTEVEDAHVAGPRSHLDVGDPGERLRFQVMECFRAHNARCQELASLFFSGLDWIQVAAQAGVGYAAVRKQWSRCLEFLRSKVLQDEDLRDSLWSFWGDSDA